MYRTIKKHHWFGRYFASAEAHASDPIATAMITLRLERGAEKGALLVNRESLLWFNMCALREKLDRFDMRTLRIHFNTHWLSGQVQLRRPEGRGIWDFQVIWCRGAK